MLTYDMFTFLHRQYLGTFRHYRNVMKYSEWIQTTFHTLLDFTFSFTFVLVLFVLFFLIFM